MIQLFDIKKKVKQMKKSDKELFEDYSNISKKDCNDILNKYNTSLSRN